MSLVLVIVTCFVILSTSSFALGADTLGDFLESLCPVVERDLFSDSSFDDYDEFSYSSFAAALKLASDVKFNIPSGSKKVMFVPYNPSFDALLGKYGLTLDKDRVNLDALADILSIHIGTARGTGASEVNTASGDTLQLTANRDKVNLGSFDLGSGLLEVKGPENRVEVSGYWDCTDVYTYGVYSALEPRSNIVDTSDNSPIPSVKIGDFLESLCPIVERDLSSEGFDDYDEYSYSSFGAALDLASDIKINVPIGSKKVMFVPYNPSFDALLGKYGVTLDKDKDNLEALAAILSVHLGTAQGTGASEVNTASGDTLQLTANRDKVNLGSFDLGSGLLEVKGPENRVEVSGNWDCTDVYTYGVYSALDPKPKDMSEVLDGEETPSPVENVVVPPPAFIVPLPDPPIAPSPFSFPQSPGDNIIGESPPGPDIEELSPSIPQFESLKLALDWKPNSCDLNCDPGKIMNSFTVLDLKPVLEDSTLYNITCQDVDVPVSSNGNQLLIGDQMSKETFEAMSCMLVNPTGANEDLWQQVYKSGGSCIGLPVDDYFSLISRRYQESDPNKAFLNLGITNRTALVKTSVNSKELKETLNEQIGRRVSLFCNVDSKEKLAGVEICLEGAPPYQIIDCQEDGQPSCGDNLDLIKSPGSGEISEYCKKFMPNGIFKEESLNSIDPNSTDEASSSNLGIILGATLGGVAALVAILLLVIISRRRIGHSSDIESMEKKSQYSSDSTKLSSISVAAPSIDFDPFITWLRSVEQRVGPVRLTHPKEFNFSKVDPKKLLGEGSFGKVYQAVYNDQKVAIKIFHNESIASEEDDLDSLQRTRDKILGKMEKEVELMASLNHPNIVRLLGFSRMPPAIMIELCSRGHLAKKFQTFREQKVLLGWKTRVRYAYEIALGLEYLHSRNIIHRDLKSPNVLLDEGDTIKLADFNLSKYIDTSSPMLSSSVAGNMNPRWLAPELLVDGGMASTSCDIFSLGVIMWEILTFNIPWSGVSSYTIQDKVKSGERLPYTYDATIWQRGIYDVYVGLMNQCWSADPLRRPTARAVVLTLKDIM